MVLRANTQDGAGSVLSEGTVCMLAGAGGISKSSLALWMALGVAGIEIGKTDAICNGLFVAQGGPVLFVSEEDKAGATSARLKAMARYAKREDAIKNLHGVSIEGMPMFGSEDIRQRPQRLEGWPRVWGSARKVGAKLVVIDPALGAYANSQNEETGIREFLGLVSREAERIGAGVLMVAHSRKSARGGKEDPFDPGQVGGSTHWTDRARGVMTLTRDTERRGLVLGGLLSDDAVLRYDVPGLNAEPKIQEPHIKFSGIEIFQQIGFDGVGNRTSGWRPRCSGKELPVPSHFGCLYLAIGDDYESRLEAAYTTHFTHQGRLA